MYFDNDKIVDEILKKNNQLFFSKDKYLNFFIKKKICSLFNEPSIYKKIYIAEAVSHYLKNNVSKKSIIIFENFTWSKNIQNYTDSFGIQSYFSPIFSINQYKNIIRSNFLIFFIFLQIYSLIIFFKKNNKKDQYNNEMKIMIRSMGVHNLSKPYLHSDMFFIHDSNIDNKNMIICEPMSHKTNLKDYNDIINLGFGFVKFKINKLNFTKNNIFIKKLKKSNFNKINKSSQLFYNKAINDFELLKNSYKNLFSKTNTKIHFSSYKFTSEHIAINAAMNEIDGISAMWQQSYEEIPSYDLLMCADVYFSFCQNNFFTEKNNGSFIKQHVVTGYPGDYRFKYLNKHSQHIRNKLKKNGCKFIISFFDENSSPDRRWGESDQILSNEYEFLLKKIIKNTKLGIVFKPKKPQSIFNRLEKIVPLINEAKKTNRCIFLLSDTNNIPPSMAAMSSDLAIHNSLFAATAAIESALCNVPTLMIDKEYWNISDLYNLKPGKIIFNNINDLWSKLEKNNFETKDNQNIWKNYITKIDPFRDGKASFRISQYLNDLLSGFDRGLSSHDTLTIASENYRKYWGNDKIKSIY